MIQLSGWFWHCQPETRSNVAGDYPTVPRACHFRAKKEGDTSGEEGAQATTEAAAIAPCAASAGPVTATR